MINLIFATSFVLGAAIVFWMGAGFIDTDPLALTVTCIIGAVYTIGFIELIKFRQATSTLTQALRGQTAPVEILNEWLNSLHESIQNAVRLRIEGERVGLPSPVLTPYLVGLLVMLGLLGTFAGMVDTLKGAVLALEGTNELQAIRAGLAAPIKGLGMAFGTSVAGVAASAMLGLLSTLSRRERMLATRHLDAKISTAFQAFSLSFNRQETYQALQNQSQAFPEVVDMLRTLTEHLKDSGNAMSDTLVNHQTDFHQTVSKTYSDLATSVDNSLKDNLAKSTALTAEAIMPIIKDTMLEISSEIRAGVQTTHQKLSQSADKQLSDFNQRFKLISEEVSTSWQQSIVAHQHENQTLLDSQAAADQERLTLWLDSFKQSQNDISQQLANTSELFSGEMKQTADVQQNYFAKVSSTLENLSITLTEEWQKAGKDTTSHQLQTTKELQSTAQEIAKESKATSLNMLTEMSQLLNASERLLQARLETEESWLNSLDTRIGDLSSSLKVELSALKDEEQSRGLMAVDRLTELESVVTRHLATLGTALEEPMTRLIETASETPRAAAEVIGQLRQETTKNIERDNSLLEERSQTLADMNSLFTTLSQTSTDQSRVINDLVTSSSKMLNELGENFTDQVGGEVSKLSDITDLFAGSSIEIASMGEAFSQGMQHFNTSSNKLIETLNSIEGALDKSTVKSDEQLGYYVAQAREIIDHSMLSQQEIINQLQAISNKTEVLSAELN